MNKLLAKAKGYRGKELRGKKPKTTAEDAELALAYVMGEITGPQLRYAKDRLPSNETYGWVQRAIVNGIREGWLRVK